VQALIVRRCLVFTYVQHPRLRRWCPWHVRLSRGTRRIARSFLHAQTMIHLRIVLLGNQSKEIEMKIAKLVTAIALSVSLGFAAQAQEETPVEMKDLPSEAQTTIKEKAGNDQILRVAKETRKGKECYDAVVNRDGKEMAIRVDANGKFIGTHPEKGQQKEKAEKY
jgi:hypothetical protein